MCVCVLVICFAQVMPGTAVELGATAAHRAAALGQADIARLVIQSSFCGLKMHVDDVASNIPLTKASCLS